MTDDNLISSEKQTFQQCCSCHQKCIRAVNFGYCGYGYNVDEAARKPSSEPFKYNLMYGRINLLVIIYLCITPIIISQYIPHSTVAHYCQNHYDFSTDHVENLTRYDVDVIKCYGNYRECGQYSQIHANKYWKYYSETADGCIQDTLCQNVTCRGYNKGHHYQMYTAGCLTTTENCCAANNSFDMESMSIFYFALLGLNLFRLFIVTPLCAIGRSLHNEEETGYYTVNKDTIHVELKQYMIYLCDHPASYIIAILYPDANRAITEAIIYNITLPSTHFLYFNISFLYIPFIFVFCYLLHEQMQIFIFGNSSINSVVLITVCIGLIIVLSGLSMTIYRWRTKNIIEARSKDILQNEMKLENIDGGELISDEQKETVESLEQKERDEPSISIKSIDHSLEITDISDDEISINSNSKSNCFNIWSMFGFDKSSNNNYKRIASVKPNKFNLWYRWINLMIYIYLWIPLVYGIMNISHYGGFKIFNVPRYDEALIMPQKQTKTIKAVMIIYAMILCFNTFRLIVLTLCLGLMHVDNKLNYIKDEKTNKLQLKLWMDYLSDHPVSLFICLLYKDVNKAIYEALVYDLAYPFKVFLFINVVFLYIPMLIISCIQLSYDIIIYNKTYKILWILSVIVCIVGIILSGYRLRSINQIKQKQFVAKTKMELVSLVNANQN